MREEMRRQEIRKFGVLVSSQLLSDRELAEDVEHAARTGVSAAAVMMSRRHISKGSVGYALYAHYGAPFLEDAIPSPELAREAGAAHLREHCWLPLRQDEAGTVHVWTDDPSDAAKLGEIRRALGGAELRVHVGLREDVLRRVSALTPPSRTGAGATIAAVLALAAALSLPAAAAPTGAGDDSAPKIGVAQPSGPLDTEAKRAEMVSRAAELPLEFVQAMRESGLDWDHITRDLLITLGPDRRPWRGALLGKGLKSDGGLVGRAAGGLPPGGAGTVGAGAGGGASAPRPCPSRCRK